VDEHVGRDHQIEFAVHQLFDHDVQIFDIQPQDDGRLDLQHASLNAPAGKPETFLLDELRDFPHNLNARAKLATLYHQSMGQTDDAARVAADLVRITPSPEAYKLAARLAVAPSALCP